MSFDFDVDEMDPELDMIAEDLEGSELGDEAIFEEIDFDSLGIDPGGPTVAKPGSEEKVLMLAARYAAGVPLWHENDCYDHSPGAVPRLIQKG
jgi:hypothetical protein